MSNAKSYFEEEVARIADLSVEFNSLVTEMMPIERSNQ